MTPIYKISDVCNTTGHPPLKMDVRTCVIFATKGRPAILQASLRALARQTLRPARVIIACSDPSDVMNIAPDDIVSIIFCKPGLPAQRNNALRELNSDADILVFFDDDFIADPRWIEEITNAFRTDPKIGGITGTVLADGINGPGYSESEALSLLESKQVQSGVRVKIRPCSPYGCNMAFRYDAIQGLQFDERLVLYGWQEDRDFGGQVALKGWNLVKISTALGVHLGTKTGRVPGKKLGYSQVINPAYLARKGTVSRITALDHVLRNFLKNLARSFVPEPYVDRFGRFCGNLIGFCDLLRGRITPERAEKL